MTNKVFTDYNTVIDAAWLNDVNTSVNTTVPGLAASKAELAGSSTQPFSASDLEIGDQGLEGSGINIGGVTYESSFKVSDIDGTHFAQSIFHRHSTLLEPLLVGARSNSDTSTHAAVVAGQGLFTTYAAGTAGTNYKLFGSSSFVVDTGTVSDTSAPGKWVLSLTPDGSVSPTPVVSVSNAGVMTANVVAPMTVAATSKTTPVDADLLPLVDSAASNGLKSLSWANLRATANTSPTFTGTPTAPTAAPGTNTTQLATTAFVATAVGGASTQVPVRQTVLQSPVDSNGLPTFLASTYGGLVVTSQNVSTGANSLVATAMQGFNVSGAVDVIGQATSNLTWPACTASNTNYMPVSISGGVLTAETPVILAPIEQRGGTPSITAGQYTIDTKKMTVYLGNGTTAPAVNHVIVGEAIAGASTITSTVAYALMGEAYVSQSTLAVSTRYQLSTNIGTMSVKYMEASWVNKTAEYGYVAGDKVSIMNNVPAAGSSYASQTSITSRNTLNLSVGGSFIGTLIPLAGGSSQTMTTANWSFEAYIKRSW